MTDERQARIDAIRSDLARPWQEVERAVETARWLLSELEAATASAERRKPCPLGLEYRDGVVCSEFGDTDACASHQVVRGLRKHGVDADRFELENRELRARAERAEAANTAVLRANADEIADLEDVRDDLEAKVNALTAQVAALRRQVRATYGIIHEGLHGGKPTDPEHQEACEKPSCRNARAALAAAGGEAQDAGGEGQG